MFPESGIGVITAGYSLSVALLIAVLAIHVIKWSFLRSRHFRKRRAIWIFHMCAVLIFSYIIMFCARLFIHFEPDKNSRESCIAAMATSQTIILTIFFWLLNKIRLKIYIARLNFKSPYRHSLSIAFGYGLPLLIVGVTLSVTLGVQDSKYVHGNDFTNCVISRKNNVIAWSFLLPSGLCLLYDLVGMIYVLLSLFDNWQKLGIVGKARLQRCFNSPSSVTTINDSILISVNTVMWLMALLYYYEEKGSSKTYADLFTIWHSLFVSMNKVAF